MFVIKLAICIAYDLFDFTAGRLLFVTPFAGEIVGVGLGVALFGSGGLFYALEAFDPTRSVMR